VPDSAWKVLAGRRIISVKRIRRGILDFRRQRARSLGESSRSAFWASPAVATAIEGEDGQGTDPNTDDACALFVWAYQSKLSAIQQYFFSHNKSANCTFCHDL